MNTVLLLISKRFFLNVALLTIVNFSLLMKVKAGTWLRAVYQVWQEKLKRLLNAVLKKFADHHKKENLPLKKRSKSYLHSSSCSMKVLMLIVSKMQWAVHGMMQLQALKV